MRVLLALDKFRGTATARQAAEAIETGWRRRRPTDELDIAPMADGGEGTLDALVDGSGRVIVRATGPFGDPVDAVFGLRPDATAVVEMARVAGIDLVGGGRGAPGRTTTRGVGALVVAALDRGATTILVCLGGSSTNDGGTGLARALGVRFLDDDGRDLPEGGLALARLARIVLSGRDPRLGTAQVLGLCDVDNPLVGPRGASLTFGPQKGASPEEVWDLEQALVRLATVAARDLGVDLADEPGAGAAGGLGFGLLAFCGARLRRGVDVVADAVGLDARIQASDLVVTGEGALDATSFGGKVVGSVCERARLASVPSAVIVGRADVRPPQMDVTTLVDLVGEAAATTDARHALERAGEVLAARADELVGAA